MSKRNKKPLAAFKIMHPLFVAIPLITGIDKFFNKITVWENYVSPAIPVGRKQIAQMGGVYEIALAYVVYKKPRLGSVMLAGLLGALALNLLTIPKQKHIALLDTSLAVCALSFATLLPGGEGEA